MVAGGKQSVKPKYFGGGPDNVDQDPKIFFTEYGVNENAI